MLFGILPTCGDVHTLPEVQHWILYITVPEKLKLFLSYHLQNHMVTSHICVSQSCHLRMGEASLECLMSEGELGHNKELLQHGF